VGPEDIEMKNEETEDPAIEPEVVEKDTALASPALPVSINELASSEEGLVRLERGIQIVKTLRRASIALTYPHDWILYKAEDRITGYLQDVGVQRVWDLWGIEQFDLGKFERTDDKETGDFSISITSSAFCKRTGQTIENITGTRYSYEEFIVKRKLKRLQIEPEVKKAARANMDGNQGRELMGLKSVPMEELDEVWASAGMTWKSSKFCPRGRGFGTQAERSGAQVQQADDLKPGEEPICEQCDNGGKITKMKFVPAGTSSRTGKPYDAFWSCTVQNSGHKTVQHEEYKKILADRRKATREPGSDDK
jgi:hypothetical protein